MGRHRVAFLLAAVAWLVACAAFWTWWLQPSHRGNEAAFWINSFLLAFEFAVLPAYFLFFASHARVCAPHPLPNLRVAMIVTRAPSEPWALARRTLAAMLAQDIDRPYDVWLADEDPSPEIARWCDVHGVHLITRRGVPGYHQASWPRRARCKEGNLAYFYDRVGYDSYDVVSQLDVDHVPEPGYLAAVLRPFADDAIGWVAAPSICDANASRSWSARGRLFVEAAMHGAVQAGGNGGWAPCAIGSHYAVRTRALRSIGGLGPELAEDFSTTLLLASEGWQGAFAIDAEAHGKGPATLEDAATQDLQWSRSMMTVTLTIAARALRRARPRARVKLAFCLAWYPWSAGVLLALHLLPVFAVVTGIAPAHVRLLDFWAHLAAPVLVLVGAVWLLRRAGLMRPVDAPVISWEAILFGLVRWPWVLLGCLQGVVGRVFRHSPEWKITPKGTETGRPLKAAVLGPPLTICVVSAGAALFAGQPGDARGYWFWCLANALLYLGVAAAIAILHRREARVPGLGLRARLRRLPRPTPLAPAAARVGTFAIAAVILAAAVGVRRDAVADAVRGPQAPLAGTVDLRGLSWPVSSSARRIGVTTPGLATRSFQKWSPEGDRDLSVFSAVVRRRVGVVSMFSDWAHGPPSLADLEAIRQYGAEPEITWEPWDSSIGPYHDQPKYSLQSIAEGRHDALIRRFATIMAAYGDPVRVRFMHEMNAPAYPWSALRVTDGWKWYIAAWQHVHDVVDAAGATNVEWVWAPVAGRPASGFYPGDKYVDVLGISGFNGGEELQWSGWRSFAAIFEDSLKMLEKRAPGKPIEISEVSTAQVGGDRAAWIRGMWQTLERHPRVRSVTWFDLVKETDWSLGISSAAGRAFGDGARAWLGAAETPNGTPVAPPLIDAPGLDALPVG